MSSIITQCPFIKSAIDKKKNVYVDAQQNDAIYYITFSYLFKLQRVTPGYITDSSVVTSVLVVTLKS